MPPQEINIAGRRIGPKRPCFIIAEAGVNHNGDVSLAKALIRVAKESGADCVKFQTFSADRLVTRDAPKAAYQLATTNPAESQFAMLRRLELPCEAYSELLETCDREKILLLSTPYDTVDVDFLDAIGMSAFKIPSAYLVEPLFLQHVARKGKPIFLSTGMSTLAEVDEAVRTIRVTGNDQIILLQCTTNYPSRAEDTNLLAMQSMKSALDVLVGYSDHTQTETACVAAVALGACTIEKHFTLDKSLPGPDQQCSADPCELRRLVKSIREAQTVLGSPLKQLTDAERTNIAGMRRSLVAGIPIKCGTVITESMILCKRPASGISPAHLSMVIGRTAVRDIPVDAMIRWEWLQ